MAAPKPQRTTSLGDHSTDSYKMEGSGGWDDTLDWFKLEEQHPVSRSVSHHANYKCLLESERVMVEGRGIVLINTDEAGTLLVTNFRLIFMSEGTENVIALGTIPLAAIEKFSKMVVKNQSAPRQSDKSPQRLLQVIGKDMRIIVFGFRPKTRQRRVIFDALLRCTKPSRLWDLYAFTCGPSKFSSVNPKVRLLNEYFRLLGKGSLTASMDLIEHGSYTLSNELWRISTINCNYTMCQSYPFALLVPKSISDEEVLQASSFRAKCRLPVVTWCHPGTGAVLARSSQPLVGLMMNMRSNTDEKLVAALCSQPGGGRGRRKLYIADARPRKNALANVATGGGSESSSNYFQSEVVFFGIDNIHAMRESLSRLRDYLDTHGTTSSDGMSSFLRHGNWTWGGGNLSSMSASVSTLGDTGWLIHVQSVLAGSAWIAARVALESASVLVHCSDGWDRTTQLVSLANLLLDPYYRTFAGFQALIEKDWLAFGHPFADRLGIPTVSGSGSMPSELSRQSSVGSFSSSPVRQSSGAFTSQTPSSSHAQNNYSPIFLQWVDCVSQLMRMYPFAFEFSSAFLVDLLDCVLSCRFGNFFCNSEKERQQVGVSEDCGCLWAYLVDLRSSGERSHAHYNLFYDAQKHDGPLLPPAAALAPTLWPQFHLRWACPSEAQSGEVEAQFRNMSTKFFELQKAKEVAEKKAREATIAMESLSAELRNEKQLSGSARALAKRASKETAAIRRAIQSLGCKVHFASSGDTTVDVETSSIGTPQNLLHSSSKREFDGTLQQDEKDLSVSVTVVADDAVSNNPIGRVCETLCPLRTRDGGCRWPEAGCAQLSSQFVGLKANYDAFDRLSIYDSYFETE
ncbi:phosphatidylinositol-3-phosphatase myotubularin-1 isoform X3 [Ricinus communis]|uniref:Phosphoprotein phosphatase, putative n=1 Tax=Ricinus communis TaxID=3988 RepID=B9T6R5_RICCO|nr:phosphatidylinositol-3-phosphatase myotubularin-1 isoform X3 [Ricinus communis]EEF28453.1 phosphoprotein phosphatase, putative [Ricinus communis]|eukprot:XP_002533934.1 phosphatidylinositol-3-phosphatase myotubularin-1 isoform X3 [Ricinus communis]